MLESKHMIPSATKPPTAPPTIAAVLHVHELSKGTKDVCVWVCVYVCAYTIIMIVMKYF